MPPAPQGGGQSSDNTMGIIWGVAALFAAIGVVWYVFNKAIIRGYLWLKLSEVKLLSSLFGYFSISYFEPIKARLFSALINSDQLTFNDLMLLGRSVGDILKVPFSLFLLCLAVIVYLGNTTRVFKRIYSMKSLSQLEKVNWPQITPVVNLDLTKTDIDKGPWAMALTPLQFCKRYHLLEEIHPTGHEGFSHKERGRIEVILKRGEANRIFALQMGALWPGIERVPPHVKALFVVFAARINADSKAAAALLAQLSLSANQRLNMQGVDNLIKKHGNTKLVQQIVNGHAYTHTVMASLLEGAREDGVQASADFLWLKTVDRRLWYTLNTVGRQTPFVEVAGIFAHWIAEKAAGRKLLVPMVEEATNALELALKEIIYRPETKE